MKAMGSRVVALGLLCCLVCATLIVVSGYSWASTEREHLSLIGAYNDVVYAYLSVFPSWSATQWYVTAAEERKIPLEGRETQVAAEGPLVVDYTPWTYFAQEVALGVYLYPNDTKEALLVNVSVALSSPNDSMRSLISVHVWQEHYGALRVLSSTCIIANSSSDCGLGYRDPDPSWRDGRFFLLLINVSCVNPLDPALASTDFGVSRVVPIALSSAAGLATVLFVLIALRYSLSLKGSAALLLPGLCAIVFHAISLQGLLLLDHWSWQIVVQPIGFAGLLLILFGAPGALIASLVFFHHAANCANMERKPFYTGAFSISCCGICIFALAYMVKPWALPATTPSSQDPLSALFGCFFLCVYGFFGVSSMYSSILLARFAQGPDAAVSLNVVSSDLETAPLIAENARHGLEVRERRWAAGTKDVPETWPLSIAFAVISSLCVFATTVLPPIWNSPVQGYLSLVTTDGWNWALAQGGLVLKLYPDTVAYYCFFLLFILVCTASALFKPVQRFLSRDGHVIFIVSFVAFSVVWGWYWMFYYARIASGDDTGHVSERLARACGQLSNLLLTFTCWPASRISVWHALAGVPFENIVIYHRWFGTSMIALTILHFAFWIWNWIVFDRIGNLIALQQNPHKDNFTVLLMVVVFVTAIVPLGITSIAWFRRNRHELFYRIHHLALVIFVGASIHSWGLWLYLVPPLIMLVVNRAISQYRVLTANARIVSAQVLAEEHLGLTCAWNGSFLPGQYVYICVPEVSLVEWHPFSIVSSPSHKELQLCVKSMGEGTYTSQLMKSAKAGESILIDGPHGSPPKLDWLLRERECIVFVAGGVGITPVASFFHALREYPAEKLEHIQVTVIWVVRSASTFSIMPVFLEPAEHPFRVQLFATRTDPSSSSPNVKVPFRSDHPDLASIFADCEVERKKTFVFACGPPGLVRAARAQAASMRAMFHEEIFSF